MKTVSYTLHRLLRVPIIGMILFCLIGSLAVNCDEALTASGEVETPDACCSTSRGESPEQEEHTEDGVCAFPCWACSCPTRINVVLPESSAPALPNPVLLLSFDSPILFSNTDPNGFFHPPRIGRS